jgi:hypothetical protein
MFTAISYDSSETGSTELRCDNIVNVFEHLQGKPLTPIGEYAFAYDSIGKMKEPLFDGFLAGIALLPDEVFDKSFSYVPVQYNDGPQQSTRVSALSTSYLDTPLQTRADLNYHTANHVFIMGPLTKTFMDYVDTIRVPTIFHIQGEAPSTEKSTTSYPSPLTPNGGIFPCSFNLWTGDMYWRMFRSKIDRAFTIKCKDTDLVDVTAKSNKTLEPITIKLPQVYVDLRKYMVDSILLGLDHPFTFSSLNILAIFQDMIDKDNLVSCAMLLQHTTTIPYLSLIGRRVYKFQPVPMSSYNFREFVETDELQYPAGNPNGPFDLDATIKNHVHATNEFRKRLPFEYSFEDSSTSDIVDGLGEVSESKRAPFAEGIVAKVGFMKC